MQKYGKTLVYTENIQKTLSTLTKEEYEFCQIMKNAIIPFENIYRNQNHKFTNDIIDMCMKLTKTCKNDEITNYLVIVIANGNLFESMKNNKIIIVRKKLTNN